MAENGSSGFAGSGETEAVPTVAGRFGSGHAHLELAQLRFRSEMFAEILALFDNACAVIIVCGLDGKIFFWNRGAEEKYQWKKEEAIGKSWSGLLKTRFPCEYARIEEQLFSLGRWEGELVQERKDGVTVTAASSVAVRRDDAGNPVALLVIGTPVGQGEAAAGIEKRCGDFIERLPEGVVISVDGRIAFINPAGAALLGTAAEGVVGRDVLEFVPAPMRGIAEKGLRHAFGRITGVKNREAMLQGADGREIEVELSAVPVRFDGRPGMEITFRDIARRKQRERARENAQAALKANWDRMRAIVDNMPVMMCAVDAGGVFVVWNRECERVTGFAPSEVTGNPSAFGLLFPDGELRREFVAKWTGRNSRFRGWECAVHCKDGRQRVISWSNMPGHFGLPRRNTWLFGSDITERKIAEDKLSMAHRQLLDMIEFLPDATFVVNQEKKVVAWNQAMEKLTGVSKADIIGKGDASYAVPLYGKPHPELVDMLGRDAAEIRLRYGETKEEKGTLYAERFFPLVYGGRGAFLQVKATPLYDRNGAAIGGIETIRDITEQKEYEAILRKDKDSFEKLLKERTRQLLKAQEELTDARHLSEIGMLAATVAHELRNPLAAIRMGAYNINRKSRGAILVRPHLEIIEKKIIESDQIINNLLNYSRIKSPMFEYANVRELLDEALASVTARFYGWKVEVSIKEEGGGISVQVDPLQIKEMLANILTNAYEALRDKSGSIAVHIKYGKNAFGISVSDNGEGISPDNLRKIARPFFTTKSKGTGLGLAVCRQMATMHGGKIKFKSSAGKGTTVTLSLPLRH